MVEFDVDAGGIVALRFVPPYAPGDEAAYLARLEDVAASKGPFAFLAVLGGGAALSVEGRRAQALWFKRTRPHLERTCVGVAMVRPGATEATAEVFRRLWSFPVVLAPSEEDARRALAPLLAASSPEEETS